MVRLEVVPFHPFCVYAQTSENSLKMATLNDNCATRCSFFP